MEHQKQPGALLLLMGFSAFLTVGGILYAAMPKMKDSEMENRALSVFPQFSLQALESGSYIDSLDMHFADHFPFREWFVSFANKVKYVRGFHTAAIEYYQAELPQETNDVWQDAQITDEEMAELIESDSLVFDPQKLENTAGIAIYDGMAIPLFSGSTKSAQKYLDVMQFIRSVVDSNVRIYSMILPTHVEFYLPQEAKPGGMTEGEIADYIDAHLPAGVKPINILNRMRIHQNEYTYYNTDHHWTGLGAYYAYEEFCYATQQYPVPLQQMRYKENGRFLGSLYKRTQNPTIKERGDSLILHIPTMGHAASELSANLKRKSSARLVHENSSTYGAYLGGDIPCLRFETDNKNGKRLLVVKNSFGNALSTYMISHFEEVFVIDYRYFKGSAVQLIRQFGVTDVLFPQPAVFALSKGHVGFMRSVFSRNGVEPDPPKQEQPKTERKSVKVAPADTIQP
ncbi:MAG: DHHW family protein [Flavobacteriales bacterium]